LADRELREQSNVFGAVAEARAHRGARLYGIAKS
jgi:hypothetical protein